MRVLQPGESPDVIVTARWRPHRIGVPGSTHDHRCAACRHPVVLAPESRPLLAADPPPALYCMECVPAMLARYVP